MLAELGLTPKLDRPEEFLRLASMYACSDPATGFGVDVSFVDSEYLKLARQRAVKIPTDGYPVPYLSVEDLLIHKVVAARERDHSDAVELIARYPDIDRAFRALAC